MGSSLKFYSDSALTTELTTLSIDQDVDSATPQDFDFYIGSTVSANQFQANSSPGVDQITLSITDSGVATGHDETDFKLALSSGGLDSAVAGDPINLGTTITGGTANAIHVYLRFTNAVTTVGVSTEIGFTLNAIIETTI